MFLKMAKQNITNMMSELCYKKRPAPLSLRKSPGALIRGLVPLLKGYHNYKRMQVVVDKI
jgi:hypothetical protein